MSKVRKYGHDLVLMSKSSYQGANSLATSQIMQKLEFVLYPHWATCDVDLLNGDVSGLSLQTLAWAIEKSSR